MTRQKMKDLKKGGVVVRVRKHYQNYDHTKVVCEPKVYTISSKGMDIHLKEIVAHSWLDKGTRFVNAHGFDRRSLCENFETLEDYLSGDYNKDIVLDTEKWQNLEEFMMFKMQNDYKLARKVDDERIKKEDKEKR